MKKEFNFKVVLLDGREFGGYNAKMYEIGGTLVTWDKVDGSKGKVSYDNKEVEEYLKNGSWVIVE